MKPLPPKTRFLIINLVGLACALFLYFQLNKQTFTFQIMDFEMASSPGILLFIAYVIGAIIGAGSLVPFLAGNQEENVAKLKAWKDQDAKLALEVQADKEKQLEAKIATLEVALKQALNKLEQQS
jgi:hypothetical protein